MAFDPISLSVAVVKVVASPLIKKAWEKFKERSEKGVKAKVIPSEKLDAVYLIPQIGKPIAKNIIARFNLDPSKVVIITYDRAITPDEIHLIAGEIFRVIDDIQLIAKEIILVAPAPMPLSFILGQYVGMGYVNLKILWIQGENAYLLLDGHQCRKPMFFSKDELKKEKIVCYSKLV